MNIGVLSLQGSFAEHIDMLRRLGVEPRVVRCKEDLMGLDGIILPGGESTVQSKLLRRFGMFGVLKGMIDGGLPVWGTCAGAILLAESVMGKNVPETLGCMKIGADRNSYGGQMESFVADVSIGLDGDGERGVFSGVFIRAPRLWRLDDEVVREMCVYGGDEVFLRQGNMMACSFHPELTEDVGVHEYFLRVCGDSLAGKK